MTRAEKGLALLSIFTASVGRESRALPAGGVAVVGAPSAVQASAVAPPPALSLQQQQPSAGGGSGGEDEDNSCSPFTPSLVAPLVCPNTACGIVLEVDLPSTLGANRGLHLSCTACATGLCGHCGSPWLAGGTESHSGVSCSDHVDALQRGVINGVGDEALGPHTGAVKKCPNPTCGSPIVRCACPSPPPPFFFFFGAAASAPSPRRPQAPPLFRRSRSCLPQRHVLQMQANPVLCVPSY